MIRLSREHTHTRDSPPVKWPRPLAISVCPRLLHFKDDTLFHDSAKSALFRP